MPMLLIDNPEVLAARKAWYDRIEAYRQTSPHHAAFITAGWVEANDTTCFCYEFQHGDKLYWCSSEWDGCAGYKKELGNDNHGQLDFSQCRVSCHTIAQLENGKAQPDFMNNASVSDVIATVQNLINGVA